jgi:hypothetical protein
MDDLAINMMIFNSYVSLPDGIGWMDPQSDDPLNFGSGLNISLVHFKFVTSVASNLVDIPFSCVSRCF